MRAYMRNKFSYHGITSPIRKEFQKTLFAGLGPDIDPCVLAKQLWQVEYREAHYVACDLLRQRLARKALQRIDPRQSLETLEWLITTNSWWDTVDSLAPNASYSLLSRYPGVDLDATARTWIESENIWLQRSAIILQLKAGPATNPDLLFDLILRRADSTEFFVRKGAGWALRQYSRIDPSAVRSFINDNDGVLSPLTKREGGKYC